MGVYRQFSRLSVELPSTQTTAARPRVPTGSTTEMFERLALEQHTLCWDVERDPPRVWAEFPVTD